MKKIMVCCSSGCLSAESNVILKEIKKEVVAQEVEAKVSPVGCFGFCTNGPIVMILPEETFYEKVQLKDVADIVKAVKENKVVKRRLPKDKEQYVKKWHELDFYSNQERRVLEYSGIINPLKIKEYLAVGGYLALKKALSMKREEVIAEITESGLRGRGGAGFPTGKKWQLTYDSKGKQKYVVCNADEGDPGAFMDRSVLEGEPHSVLEGMTIAGYAIGASEGYIYVRAEYPTAVERLKTAIAQAMKEGVIGNNIFGTPFSFNIHIRLGAGAFVCGEETALLNSIEGKRGEPRMKPPYPAQSGLYACPTVINNVETLANVPKIISMGAKWFNSIGTEKSKGTKIFALSGNISNVGLVEVPMGTTLRTIIEDIGGGVPDAHEFKACQIGGPSGGCIVKEQLDTKIGYEELQEIGAMMGSGGLIVLDETKCMVNIAKFFLEFTVDESCGKCTPCRIGTKRMLEILTRITEGKGEEGDIQKLEELANSIKATSLCGLGQGAPNPVLSTLKHFRDEYEMHIKEKRCKTGECKALKRVVIDANICKQCGVCKKNCPAGAIEGEPKKGAYKILQNKCIKCGVCVSKCPFNAISYK